MHAHESVGTATCRPHRPCKGAVRVQVYKSIAAVSRALQPPATVFTSNLHRPCHSLYVPYLPMHRQSRYSHHVLQIVLLCTIYTPRHPATDASLSSPHFHAPGSVSPCTTLDSPRSSLLPLRHEVLVERLDLADVVLDTGAQRGHSQMVCTFLLTEPGPCDTADTRRVCR